MSCYVASSFLIVNVLKDLSLIGLRLLFHNLGNRVSHTLETVRVSLVDKLIELSLACDLRFIVLLLLDLILRLLLDGKHLLDCLQFASGLASQVKYLLRVLSQDVAIQSHCTRAKRQSSLSGDVRVRTRYAVQIALDAEHFIVLRRAFYHFF